MPTSSFDVSKIELFFLRRRIACCRKEKKNVKRIYVYMCVYNNLKNKERIYEISVELRYCNIAKDVN